MADKYNLDYFDDDRVAAQRSQYRREYRQPMNRPPQNGRGPVPNNRNNVHRKPLKKKKIQQKTQKPHYYCKCWNTYINTYNHNDFFNVQSLYRFGQKS